MNSSNRKTMRMYIIENIADISDDEISKIYKKLCDILNDDNDDNNNRKHMLSYIEDNLKYIDDKNLLDIKSMIDIFLNNMTENDKKINIVIDIINKILVANEMDKINDLTDFVNIRRDILMSDVCKQIINDSKTYIFDNGFDKYKCSVYQNNLRHKHFGIFKGLLSQAGYKLVATMITKGGKYTVYSIVKINNDT